MCDWQSREELVTVRQELVVPDAEDDTAGPERHVWIDSGHGVCHGMNHLDLIVHLDVQEDPFPRPLWLRHEVQDVLEEWHPRVRFIDRGECRHATRRRRSSSSVKILGPYGPWFSITS